MLHEADVESGSCEQATREHSNEFRDLAHQFLPATAASFSRNEERHDCKHPKQHVIDRSGRRVPGCEILPYREVAKPVHKPEFRDKQATE